VTVAQELVCPHHTLGGLRANIEGPGKLNRVLIKPRESLQATRTSQAGGRINPICAISLFELEVAFGGFKESSISGTIVRGRGGGGSARVPQEVT